MCCLVFLGGCQKNSVPKAQQSNDEGLIGKIVIKEGYFDAAGNIASQGRVYSEARRVYVYQLTSMREVAYNGSFVNAIYSDLITETTTDEYGVFKLQLPVGNYSIFVQEQDQYYAELKLFRNDFYFFPVTIQRNETAKELFEVNIGIKE